MDTYQNLYRIPSTRLKQWDYASNGMYFVTMCTRNREEYFGAIIKGEMKLSVSGEAAKTCWYAIPGHFPFVSLDEFVVMPNHIHGIVLISKTHIVETQDLASLQNIFGPQSKNLASIIRGYKIGVTKIAKEQKVHFAWQSRFYDHIIRDETSLHAIREYIINNPQQWDIDENNIRRNESTV